MKWVERPRNLALIVAGVYLILVLLFIARFDFNPTSIVRAGPSGIDMFGEHLPPGTVIHEKGGYDGQAYYAYYNGGLEVAPKISIGWTHRVLYPALVFVLGLGNTRLMPIVAILLSIFCASLLTFVSARYLEKHKKPVLGALAIGLCPSFLPSITHGLVEPLSTTTLLLGLFLLLEKRYFWSGFFFTGALFTREDNILLLFIIFLWFVFSTGVFTDVRKGKNIFLHVKHIALFVYGVPLFFLFQLVLHPILGVYPFFVKAHSSFVLPFKGIVQGVIQSVAAHQALATNLSLTSWHSLLIALSSMIMVPLILLAAYYLLFVRKSWTIFAILLAEQVIVGILLDAGLWETSLPNLARLLTYLPIMFMLMHEKKDKWFWLSFAYTLFITFTIFVGEFIIYVPSPFFVL